MLLITVGSISGFVCLWMIESTWFIACWYAFFSGWSSLMNRLLSNTLSAFLYTLLSAFIAWFNDFAFSIAWATSVLVLAVYIWLDIELLCCDVKSSNLLNSLSAKSIVW